MQVVGQATGDELFMKGSVFVCDLAGSERRHTGKAEPLGRLADLGELIRIEHYDAFKQKRRDRASAQKAEMLPLLSRVRLRSLRSGRKTEQMA